MMNKDCRISKESKFTDSVNNDGIYIDPKPIDSRSTIVTDSEKFIW